MGERLVQCSCGGRKTWQIFTTRTDPCHYVSIPFYLRLFSKLLLLIHLLPFLLLVVPSSLKYPAGCLGPFQPSLAVWAGPGGSLKRYRALYPFRPTGKRDGYARWMPNAGVQWGWRPLLAPREQP